MISRRTFLATASAAAIAPVLPVIAPPAVTIGVDLASGPDYLAFAVGTPGEFDWQPIFARSAEEAFKIYRQEHGYDDEGDPRPFCADYVERIPAWDGKPAIKPADWLNAGMGHCCDRCGYETFADDGACAIGDEAVCEQCLTFAERCVVDTDRVVDDLADRICDEGAEAVEADLRKRNNWDAVEGMVWQRASELARAA